jgi:hypothetical protein
MATLHNLCNMHELKPEKNHQSNLSDSGFTAKHSVVDKGVVNNHDRAGPETSRTFNLAINSSIVVKTAVLAPRSNASTCAMVRTSLCFQCFVNAVHMHLDRTGFAMVRSWPVLCEHHRRRASGWYGRAMLWCWKLKTNNKLRARRICGQLIACVTESHSSSTAAELRHTAFSLPK